MDRLNPQCWSITPTALLMLLFFLGPRAFAAQPEASDPLISVARTMRDVEQRLARRDVSEETLARQRLVVDTLDRMLEQVGNPSQGDQAGQSSGGQAQTGSPTAEPGATTNAGQEAAQEPGESATNGMPGGQPPEQRPVGELVESLWSRLPPRQRERLQPFRAERFHPKYAAEIEAYFRRLSAGERVQPTGRSEEGGTP